MSTTGWTGWNERCVAPERLERCDRAVRTLGGAALALEDEAANTLVDRRQVAVEQLLRLVCLGRDERTFAQLEHGLLRRRPVAAGTCDEPAFVVGDGKRVGDGRRNRAGQPRDILASERRECRHRARVARGVAVALLHLGRRDEHLLAQQRDRTLRDGSHAPLGSRERACRLERQRRLPLVAEQDEELGVPARREHELERLHGLAAGLGGVEGRPAAGEQHARVREAAVGRHLRQPFRLRLDPLPREFSVRHRPATILPA